MRALILSTCIACALAATPRVGHADYLDDAARQEFEMEQWDTFANTEYLKFQLESLKEQLREEREERAWRRSQRQLRPSYNTEEDE